MTNIGARVSELLADYDPSRGPDAQFRGRQFDLGLAWVHFPEGEGGLGLDIARQAVVDRLLAAAGIPDDRWRSGIGLLLVAPTLAAFGTEDQRRRHLRPIFTGEDVWCQLFSEPGAGSDLAGLATRAVRDGDRWVVNGQKVWTSVAHVARWGILCARTDPDVPKHRGLTYFVADMTADGIEIRPLRQMTGEAEFDEVFLTDVVISDDQRIGDVGNGWAVTLATLANERLAFSEGVPARGDGPIRRLLDTWREHGGDHPHHRPRVLELAMRAEVVRLTAARAHAADNAGIPSPVWSFLKLAGSELQQEITDLNLTLQGAGGLLNGHAAPTVADSMTGFDRSDPCDAFLYARALTIAGGTSEIQRTIIAERVLGLPREPEADRDLPWRAIPRNERPTGCVR